MAFPTSLDSFSTKADNIDTVAAADINNLQTSIVAIETLIGAGSLPLTNWTPVAAFGAANVGLTYGPANAGWYTRHNGLVHFFANLVIATIGSSTGAMTVTLPVVANFHAVPFLCRWFGLGLACAQVQGEAVASTATMAILGATGSAVSLAALTNSHMANGTVLRITGSYPY